MPQRICHAATARIGYQARPAQLVLNTTVKSGSGLGKIFAPTWDMVLAFKRGDINWQRYTRRYQALLRERYRQHEAAFLEVLSREVVIVCCYCQDSHATTRHCHRYLLVDILEKVACHHAIDFEAIGEVSNSR